MNVSLAINRQLELVRERVDDRNTDSVKPAGDFVGVIIEFAAGMQHRHDDFCSRLVLLLVHADGNTATIIRNRDRTVRLDHNLDFRAMAGERLVYRVIDNLENHVMQARPVIGITDIHAGTLADSIQPLEDLDGG